jgi:hypothetical protein
MICFLAGVVGFGVSGRGSLITQVGVISLTAHLMLLELFKE